MTDAKSSPAIAAVGILLLLILSSSVRAQEDFQCFQDGFELNMAVSAYFEDPTNDEADWATTYGPIASWCVTNVTDFSRLFTDRAVTFNEDLTAWDTSNAIDMNSMFLGCTDCNPDISTWNTARVEDMNSMFCLMDSFNSDLSGWNVSSVTNMDVMFSQSRAFNQNLGGWDVSNVDNMKDMFESAPFDQDISGWNTAKVTNMEGMFRGNTVFNQDISTWVVGLVTNMKGMFRDSLAFDQDLSAWNVAAVEDLSTMFANATTFSQDLCVWGSMVNSNTSVERMFEGTACPETADPVLVGEGDAVPGVIPGPFCVVCTGEAPAPDSDTNATSPTNGTEPGEDSNTTAPAPGESPVDSPTEGGDSSIAIKVVVTSALQLLVVLSVGALFV